MHVCSRETFHISFLVYLCVCICFLHIMHAHEIWFKRTNLNVSLPAAELVSCSCRHLHVATTETDSECIRLRGPGASTANLSSSFVHWNMIKQFAFEFTRREIEKMVYEGVCHAVRAGFCCSLNVKTLKRHCETPSWTTISISGRVSSNAICLRCRS